MARTGEGYQKARDAILRERALPAPSDVDLLVVDYFGVPTILATFETCGRLAVLVVAGRHRPTPFPGNPLIALGARGERVMH
jgi:hypothetical protein